MHDAYTMITQGQAYGIDVREADEWIVGHAPDVTWNPLSNFDFENLPTDKPLIFICLHGYRSARVCNALETVREDVYNMDGGMKLWADAGLPIIAEESNPKII